MDNSWSYFVRFSFRNVSSNISTHRSTVLPLPYPVVDKNSFELLKESIKKDQGFIPNLVEIDIQSLQFLSKQTTARKSRKPQYKRPQNTL